MPIILGFTQAVNNLEKRGIGGILVQSVAYDGKVERLTLEAIRSEALEVAAAALFQFSEMTSQFLRTHLHDQGILV